jgi:hypothetical protein
MSLSTEVNQMITALHKLSIANEEIALLLRAAEEESAALLQEIALLRQRKKEADAEQDVLLAEIVRTRKAIELQNLVKVPAPPEEVPAAPEKVPSPRRSQKEEDAHRVSVCLVGEEAISLALRSIEDGSFASPTPSVSWNGKHSPWAHVPVAIIDALRAAPERSLSFKQLLQETGLPDKGNKSLQNYLRELRKQGIVEMKMKI